MTLTAMELFFTIGMIALGTMVTRFLPFVCFPDHREAPKFILYLGKVLPFSVIGLLIVYCLKDVSFTAIPFAIPEAIAMLCIVVLHIWKKNTLLSIGGGTAVYMVLVQFVFA